MGLRINTDNAAMGILRNMGQANQALIGNLQKLGSAMRINRAADDPSAMAINQLLRAQIGGLDQALNNSRTATNVLSTADAALGEAQDILVELRADIVRAGGATGEGERQAIQQSIDNRVAALDRIGATTRFGGRDLLGGGAEIRTNNVDPAVENVDIQRMNFGGQPNRQINVEVIAAAETAGADVAAAGAQVAAGGEVTVRIEGAEGTANIRLQAGATGADFYAAVNAVTGETGVVALSNGAGQIRIESRDVGSTQYVRAEQVGGDGTFNPGVVADTGADIQAFVGGRQAAGTGNVITVAGNNMQAEITMAAGTGPGNYAFTAESSGMTFQLNANATPADQLTVGIERLGAAELGGEAGNLDTIMTGGSNDIFTDPRNAIRVVDQAIAEVSNRRANIGAVQADIIESNVSAVETALNELTASKSAIADLDYAREIVDQTRNRMLLESNALLLGAANLQRENVLGLLT